ncbi:MAG: flagellar FliJ family protein, partial [Myxococcota bacterium]
GYFMRGTLIALPSIRDHQKRVAGLEYMEAEHQRTAQEAHLNALDEEVAAVRIGADEEDACWMAQRQSWCLQMEMRRRTEQRQLDQRTAEAERRRETLEAARQQARIVELVIEHAEDAAAAEARRAEQRRNNEIGMQGWWRRCG